MVDFLNPESAKQMADQLSNLWKQAEKIAPSDIKTSLPQLINRLTHLGKIHFATDSLVLVNGQERQEILIGILIE